MSSRKPKRSGAIHLWSNDFGSGVARCGVAGAEVTGVEVLVTCRRCLNFSASGTGPADIDVTAKRPWKTAQLAQRERRAAKK